MFSLCFKKYLGLEFLDPAVTAHRVSSQTLLNRFPNARPAPSAPATHGDPTCSAPSATLGILSHLHLHPPSGCEVVSHHGFNLHSSEG